MPLLALPRPFYQRLMPLCVVLPQFIPESTVDMADIALTLHVGREEFPYRAAFSCNRSDRKERQAFLFENSAFLALY